MNYQKFIKYLVRDINNDFLIKITGVDSTTGKKLNTLVGVNGLVRYVGIELANKFLERAYRLDWDMKCVCKLRRGIQVNFYMR